MKREAKERPAPWPIAEAARLGEVRAQITVYRRAIRTSRLVRLRIAVGASAEIGNSLRKRRAWRWPQPRAPPTRGSGERTLIPASRPHPPWFRKTGTTGVSQDTLLISCQPATTKLRRTTTALRSGTNAGWRSTAFPSRSRALFGVSRSCTAGMLCPQTAERCGDSGVHRRAKPLSFARRLIKLGAEAGI